MGRYWSKSTNSSCKMNKFWDSNVQRGDHSCCCCSVGQSCLSLCDPMDGSTPGFPVLHHLPGLLTLMSFESVMDPTISSVVPFSSCLQSFPASGSFPMSQLFALHGQRIGAS